MADAMPSVATRPGIGMTESCGAEHVGSLRVVPLPCFLFWPLFWFQDKLRHNLSCNVNARPSDKSNWNLYSPNSPRTRHAATLEIVLDGFLAGRALVHTEDVPVVYLILSSSAAQVRTFCDYDSPVCSVCDLFKYPCNTETTASEATMAKYAEGCVGLRLAACSFGTSQCQSRTQIEAPSSAFFRDRSSRQSIHTISWPDAVQESVRAGAVTV